MIRKPIRIVLTAAAVIALCVGLVFLVGEIRSVRRSSIEAHAILHSVGKKEKQHRKTVDAVAASLLLEGYLGKR